MERPGQDALVKYFRGESDSAEEKLIELYLAMDIDQDYVKACLKEAAEKMEHEPKPEWIGEGATKAWNDFEARKFNYPSIPVKTIPLWKKLTIAASVLLCIAVGAIYLKPLSDPNNKIAKNTAHHIQTDRGPGGNRATLTLANGRRIDLNSVQNGAVAMQGQTNIVKTTDDKLVYNTGQEQAVDTAALINMLTTPNGGQYKLTLPDGSKVWLNAASSIQYPTKFTGSRREVTLQGEAYFEVAKNARMPFTVKLNTMNVEVLGTHFNIMAYNDEPSIKTTLLEGSVRLSNAEGQQMLKPGQEGILTNNTTRFVIREANTEQALAWKNGQFIFENENIASISRKLTRWYDVSVTDSRKTKDLTYTGSISKYKNVSEVLKMLELTGTLHFRIEDRRVTIM
ncbi:MAG: FecR domain-containing protein [Mucilaginibacter sp.]|uniref:FecR family protein n=1 Tax=Mucilaginibacter sp. TaxID=1882438 RepID=UPI0031B1BE98